LQLIVKLEAKKTNGNCLRNDGSATRRGATAATSLSLSFAVRISDSYWTTRQHITVPGGQTKMSPIPPKRIVLPTIQTLRTLEAFQSESDDALQQELARLHQD
jgi:hypothetical protein